jgi:hypothetical protein
MIDRYTRREFEARVRCIAILDSELTTTGESSDNASINFTNYMVGGIRDIYFSVKARGDANGVPERRSPRCPVFKSVFPAPSDRRYTTVAGDFSYEVVV